MLPTIMKSIKKHFFPSISLNNRIQLLLLICVHESFVYQHGQLINQHISVSSCSRSSGLYLVQLWLFLFRSSCSLSALFIEYNQLQFIEFTFGLFICNSDYSGSLSFRKFGVVASRVQCGFHFLCNVFFMIQQSTFIICSMLSCCVFLQLFVSYISLFLA